MAVFGDFIVLKMKIKDKDGNVLEEGRAKGDVFVYGLNKILPRVDETLAKMKAGEKKTLTLEPNEAYGPVIPDLIKTYPASQFKNPPKVGDVLESRGPHGEVYRGMVKKVENGRITIDFNSPYAGKTLVFDIEVLDVAKDEEGKINATLKQYDADGKVNVDMKAKKLTTKDKEVYSKIAPTIFFLFPEYEFVLEEQKEESKAKEEKKA